MGDFSLALVIVAVVVSVLMLLVSVYLLVNYQHPDDANQAYFPKLVIVLGLTVAVLSILMLPADVANRQACRKAVCSGACNLTLPMRTLWLVSTLSTPYSSSSSYHSPCSTTRATRTSKYCPQ
jgi:LMBR1 domain-containing protein 1